MDESIRRLLILAAVGVGLVHVFTMRNVYAGPMPTTVDRPSSLSTMQRSNVHQLLLENGLQAVWEEDHRQPLVAIEVRIKGGLRGEGRYVGTGITHFIEHMLFKGTPTRPPGSIDQEVRRYGGTINAFTSMDVTGINLFVESRYLHDALGMVADILQHTVFDQTEFDKERAVIISELQMNLDDPQRRVQQLFWGRHLLEHPYRHPILGYQPLLEQLTLNDLSAFYASQYYPQNITIACAGDLDGAAFPSMLKELFGGWARGRIDPQQQLVPVEPPPVSAKEAVVELPVQAAYVMLGFSSTRLSDPATYPLDVLANILGEGRSSRLYDTIVRNKQLAYAISAWNYTPFDPGIFVIQFRTDPNKVEAATQAILEIVKDIQDHGVTETELHKAQHATSAAYLFNLQTVEDRAADLANSFAATGDPLFSRHYVTRVEGVTAAQVQAAAQQYCTPATMTTAILHPPVAAEATSPAAAQRVSVTKHSLKNGATLLLGVDRTLPIAAIIVAFRGGVRVEQEHEQGLSNLVAQMLTKGTSQHTALEIAQQIESSGGNLEPFSGRDGAGLILQLLAQDLDSGLGLAHELVTQATFPEEELRVQRQLIAKQLQAQEDEVFDVGGRLLRETLFVHHPYRFNPLGDRQTITTLTREQCVAFAKQWLAPSNTVIAVFGDIQPERVAQQVEHSFGAIPPHTAPWPQQLPEDPLQGVREQTTVMEKEQALIMLGFRGSTHTAPDRYTLDVLTAVLSGMAGRLFQAVREKHGLSYTLGAANVPGWDPGYVVIYAATRPTEQDKVLTVLQEQLQLILEKGFTQEEIDQAKRYLIGISRMDLQQLVGLGKRSTLDELFGLGFNAWTTYEDNINAVTLAQVNQIATRYLTLQSRAQIIVAPNSHAHQ